MQNAVQTALSAAPHVKASFDALGGPAGLAGRMLGFGEPELRSGIPGWAWFLMGAALGGAAVWIGRRQLERVIV
jgi:hypothetical protein